MPKDETGTEAGLSTPCSKHLHLSRLLLVLPLWSSCAWGSKLGVVGGTESGASSRPSWSIHENFETTLRVCESCSVVSNSLRPHGQYSPWNSPSQNTGVGSLSLLQGIFPPQGSNPGLLPCRQILYQLSHKGSPRILEWVAYPFSRGSSRPRN